MEAGKKLDHRSPKPATSVSHPSEALLNGANSSEVLPFGIEELDSIRSGISSFEDPKQLPPEGIVNNPAYQVLRKRYGYYENKKEDEGGLREYKEPPQIMNIEQIQTALRLAQEDLKQLPVKDRTLLGLQKQTDLVVYLLQGKFTRGGHKRFGV